MSLEKGSLAFTVCQVPTVYKIANHNQIEVKYENGNTETFSTLTLSHELSQKIFQRTGEVVQVAVSITI
jgi:hypothetical protein